MSVMNRKTRTAAVTTAVLIVALVTLWLLNANLLHSGQQSTDDAYIRADITQLSPRVGGLVTEVLVADNQRVTRGQLLARIDPDLYQAQLQQAEAQADSARARQADARASLLRQSAIIASAAATRDTVSAELTFARQQRSRYQQMAQQGAGSQQDFQQASADLSAREAKLAQTNADWQAARSMLPVLQARSEDAESAVSAAQAQLKLARLHASWTQITAPEDGIVTGRWLRVGQFVSPGTPLLSLVPTQHAYIVANFQETQLTAMRPGQAVQIEIDGYPGQIFSGSVESIAPASGSSLSTLAAANATGNFTKIVQRIPVRVAFGPQASDALSAGLLRVGMSSRITVNTHEG